MEGETKFSILTRAHLRPAALTVALESIAEQNYKNVTVRISVDCPGGPSKRIAEDFKARGLDVRVREFVPLGYPRCNLYLNEMAKDVESGWVLILDDDDKFVRPNVLSELDAIIREKDPRLIMTRFLRPRGEKDDVFPPDDLFGQPPVFRRIGSPCVVVPVETFRRSPLAPQKGGDFAMISRAWELTPKDRIAFVKEPTVRTQTGESLGRAELRTFDIVVPIFNQGDKTRRCLESIRKYSRDYRVIAIDNGSEDAEKVQWENLLRPGEDVLIENDTNQGFVKAVNAGLRATEAPYIVLLNNDTEAAAHWLDKLRRPFFDVEARIGAVGPLSSTPSQWQGREAFSWGWRRLAFGRMLAFFCVMIRRDAFVDTGYLDEDFGIGLGDDDDYCRRLQEKGWGLGLVTELTILHHHRSTFKALYSKAEIDDLQAKARRILDEKKSVPVV